VSRRGPFELLLLALVIGLGTRWGGWWAVPLLAAGWQWLRPGSAWSIGVAALLAWGGLLLLLPPGPFGRLLERMGGLTPLPGPALLVLPLGYALLLGWGAARLTLALRKGSA
jgi:hypothetical protein